MNAALGEMLRSRLGNRFVFFLLAALIGALVGLSTLLLIQLILLFQWVGYGEASELRYAQIVAASPAWQVVSVPCIGGLLVGLLIQFLPGKRYRLDQESPLHWLPRFHWGPEHPLAGKDLQFTLVLRSVHGWLRDSG